MTQNNKDKPNERTNEPVNISNPQTSAGLFSAALSTSDKNCKL